MAKIWNLPIVYICENNQYGMGTDFRRVSSVTDFSAMAAAYGIPGKQVNGMDVREVFRDTSEAVERARDGVDARLPRDQDLPVPRPLDERPGQVPHAPRSWRRTRSRIPS